MLSDKKTDNAILDRLISNMVYVEGGTFMMGVTDEQRDVAEFCEYDAHEVTLSPFYICKYAVTQKEYSEVMGDTELCLSGDNLPVEDMNWDKCQTFIQKLNDMTGLNFRLPTEAEWEFAARGGNKSCGYKYAGSNDLEKVAWYGAAMRDSGSVHEVGTKAPNELGLYDMSGNVFEFCQDWWQRHFENTAVTDPTGPASGSYQSGNCHILRGGCFASLSDECRVSARDDDYGYDGKGSFPETLAGTMGEHIGCRLALSYSET